MRFGLFGHFGLMTQNIYYLTLPFSNHGSNVLHGVAFIARSNWRGHFLSGCRAFFHLDGSYCTIRNILNISDRSSTVLYCNHSTFVCLFLFF